MQFKIIKLFYNVDYNTWDIYLIKFCLFKGNALDFGLESILMASMQMILLHIFLQTYSLYATGNKIKRLTYTSIILQAICPKIEKLEI